MAGLLMIYIRVIISWECPCVIFCLGGTGASKNFFNALEVELATLSRDEKSLVRVLKEGTHVSNMDWRRPEVWPTVEEQISSVSASVKKTGSFLLQFINEVVIPTCSSRGILVPHIPSFFDTLVKDNLRARYVQANCCVV
jgi:hypothetical protein